MSKTNPRDWRVLKADICFGILAIASLVMLVAESFDDLEAVAAPERPLVAAGVSIVLMLVLSFLAARFAEIDRRCSEEYTYGLIGHAAIIAVMTGLLFHFFFGQSFLFGSVFGKMSADSLIGVMLGSWAIGYFTYRIRGTA